MILLHQVFGIRLQLGIQPEEEVKAVRWRLIALSVVERLNPLAPVVHGHIFVSLVATQEVFELLLYSRLADYVTRNVVIALRQFALADLLDIAENVTGAQVPVVVSLGLVLQFHAAQIGIELVEFCPDRVVYITEDPDRRVRVDLVAFDQRVDGLR